MDIEVSDSVGDSPLPQNSQIPTLCVFSYY